MESYGGGNTRKHIPKHKLKKIKKKMQKSFDKADKIKDLQQKTNEIDSDDADKFLEESFNNL